MNKVRVHKHRTNVITVDLGIDVSSDTLTSEVRTEEDPESALIMTWTVDFVSDGSDGKLTLTVDNTATEQITVDSGYMDIKRVTSGEPIPVFDKPLEVTFIGAVTA